MRCAKPAFMHLLLMLRLWKVHGKLWMKPESVFDGVWVERRPGVSFNVLLEMLILLWMSQLVLLLCMKIAVSRRKLANSLHCWVHQ